MIRYLAIQQMLTEDQWTEAGDELGMIRREAERLAGDEVDTLSALAEQVAVKAAIDAENIGELRDGFFELSQAMLAMVQAFPPAGDTVARLYHAYCPMVKKDWLQASDQIRNPYDPTMLECGTIKMQIMLNASTGDHQHETE